MQHRKVEDSDNNNNNNNLDPEPEQSSAEEVYGVVRTSPPQQQQQQQQPQQQQQQQQDKVVLVRDPAKEIYGYLRSGGRGHHRGHQPQVFGSVRTHAPPKTEPTYLDVLQQKLFSRNPDNTDQAEPIYGVVRHHAPENAGNSGSSFETVRGLMSADSSAETSPSSGFSGNEEGSSFDLIRERLLNTRNRNRNNPDPEKSLRRKNSRKRRRNVRADLFLIIIHNY